MVVRIHPVYVQKVFPALDGRWSRLKREYKKYRAAKLHKYLHILYIFSNRHYS